MRAEFCPGINRLGAERTNSTWIGIRVHRWSWLKRTIAIGGALHANFQWRFEIGESDFAKTDADGVVPFGQYHKGAVDFGMSHVEQRAVAIHKSHFQPMDSPGMISTVRHIAAQPEVAFTRRPVQRRACNFKIIPVPCERTTADALVTRNE